MAWYWFLLVAAIVIAVFVWDYRKKASQREAARKERFERIFEGRGPSVSPASPAGPEPNADGSAGVAVAAPQARPAAVERFLGNPERLTYLLLKTSIPDHEIFARVTLAALVGSNGEGAQREHHWRRLSQYHLDFVVCDREMRIVAAIELETGIRAELAGEQRVKVDYLKAAGIRLVRLNAGSLPRRDELRALVCGEASRG